MGWFDWIGKIAKPLMTIAKPIVHGVGSFINPIVKSVSGIAKPLWDTAKKVGSFIPGASEAMEAIEGIGGSLLGTAQEEGEGAIEDMRDAGEAIQDTNMKNYRATRRELEDTYQGIRGRGGRIKDALQTGWSGIKQAGKKFADTARRGDAWGEMYGGDPEEEEEDNNYRRKRAEARAKRRQQRSRRIEEYE
jgi:phage-related protein